MVMIIISIMTKMIISLPRIIIGVVWGEGAAQFLASVPDIIYAVLISLFYYIGLESLFGRTVGKLVTGTIVVNELGSKASFGQIIGRSFARLIPFEAFSFLGSTGRGWHDSLPKTYVIKCR